MPTEPAQPKAPVYLIDTSAFVVFDELYPQERWGAIWDFLLEQVNAGTILTTDEVVAELNRRFYDLKITEWVKLHAQKIKITSKPEHFEYLRGEVYPKCNGLINPDITDTTYADPMLLAISGHEGFVLVTDEGKIDVHPNTNPLNLKLPNHCNAMDIPCISGRYAWTELLNRAGLVVDKFKTITPIN